MEIFKFGGASVKDAAGLGNVLKVLRHFDKNNDLVIVVSAMGKTTNALEDVLNAYFNFPDRLAFELQQVKQFHLDIVESAFLPDSRAGAKKESIVKIIDDHFEALRGFLNQNTSEDYSYVYDQVVPYGELLSSKILQAFLAENEVDCSWLDIRTCLKTDDYFRSANPNWETSEQLLADAINTNKITVTQGFIASTGTNVTTTLGREGSDYTAAILAYCLNAHSVTIWKDVQGVLNADPRYFPKAKLLQFIPYQEAIELAFYGATVIHPKTLQPLQGKDIPLYVKPFLDPGATGTVIAKGLDVLPEVPCFILKPGQHLIHLSSRDFAFIIEEHIAEVFRLLSQYKMKVGVIQNSAIGFSVCVEDKYRQLDLLLEKLKTQFKVSVERKVNLYTIRHATRAAIKRVEKDKHVLLKQITSGTVQLITR
ncbi:MAG: aspartate kinase [Leeuwenhoekiella sp.]